MKLNRTLAVALHRAMWTDMQTELGNNPSAEKRKVFKYEWIQRFFPGEHVINSCFLCEFANACWAGSQECQQCPISWPEKDCCHPGFSYTTAPISDILALPERDKNCADFSDDCKKYVAYYETAVVREELLSKASGIPASSAIVDHVKAIKDKAVEEYFEKNPGAKLTTMDVDQAFKRYADEQKAPIFHALAEASGLPADESVKAHISKIIERAKQNGVSLSETYRKSMLLLRDTLNKYKDELSDESGLDRNRPVGDHIKEIYDDGFSDGKRHERERIMNKIGEMLNDKSARTEKDS